MSEGEIVHFRDRFVELAKETCLQIQVWNMKISYMKQNFLKKLNKITSEGGSEISGKTNRQAKIPMFAPKF